jgi:hypothetical protein
VNQRNRENCIVSVTSQSVVFHFPQCEDASLKQSVAVALTPPVQPPEPKKKGQPAAPSPEPLKRPRLPDALLVKAVRSYLTAGKQGPEFRRNGFILDGFPKTLAQAQLLFAGEEMQIISFLRRFSSRFLKLIVACFEGHVVDRVSRLDDLFK